MGREKGGDSRDSREGTQGTQERGLKGLKRGVSDFKLWSCYVGQHNNL